MKAAKRDDWKTEPMPGQRATIPLDETDARMVQYLVERLLLRREVDCPAEESTGPETAAKTWSLIGRAMLGEFPEHED